MRNMWMNWIGIVLVVVGCDGQGETSAVSVEDSPVAAEEGVVSEEETETVEETPKKDGVEAPAESLVYARIRNRWCVRSLRIVHVKKKRAPVGKASN